MNNFLEAVKEELGKYSLKLPVEKIREYIDLIHDAQQYFPLSAQRAMAIKLLYDWKASKDKKIQSVTSEACRIDGGPCVTTFGVLGVDWPGFHDTCSGIVHEMGWNIYFTKGFSLGIGDVDLGIILIGVRTDIDEEHRRIAEQTDIIISKFHQAALGSTAKTYLLKEEIRKLEIYSQAIEYIEKVYKEDDLVKIIGLNGEAVKYFAARSRDYIENRKIKDIADQIILNYNFIKKVSTTGKTIHLKIANFATMKEGSFTGVSVAGAANLLYLEDCLKTIELTCPNFQLKHNREFTTDEGISIYRIEFVNSFGLPLTDLEQKRLEKNFDKMVLNKKRDRAQWIESIGGFEQYARAIIPLLVKETQITGKPQVYYAVCNTTDLYIDFKIIIVAQSQGRSEKKVLNKTLDNINSISSFNILSVKPPKLFGTSFVFIINLRVNMTDFDNIETIYKIIKEKISSALGKFRDFDEGMRNIDTLKLKSIRKKLDNVDKTLVRELYYSIEDFFRISAKESELISHILLSIKILNELRESDKNIHILSDVSKVPSKKGILRATASLIAFAYLPQYDLFPKVISILEPYDATISRLERNGRDILICRLTYADKVLSEEETKKLINKFKKLKSA